MIPGEHRCKGGAPQLGVGVGEIGPFGPYGNGEDGEHQDDEREGAAGHGAHPEQRVRHDRLALEANLREYHRWEDFPIENADLYADIVSAVKWAHEKSEQTALHLVQSALTSVSTDEDGPALEDASECLRHSLTQPGSSPREWSREEADRFVTAALLAR